MNCLMTKPTKWLWAQSDLRPVWSESSLCALWVAKDRSNLHADGEHSDQTGQMPSLIWVRWAHSHFVGFITCIYSHPVGPVPFIVCANCKDSGQAGSPEPLLFACVVSTLYLALFSLFLIGPRQANLVLIAYASSEGSGEPAHPRSLARTFAARSYKQWAKGNFQKESQIPGPSEWLGMGS